MEKHQELIKYCDEIKKLLLDSPEGVKVNSKAIQTIDETIKRLRRIS